MEKPKITFAGADWKDPEGMAKSFIKFIRSQGFFVYKDPSTAGSDYIGYIISNTKLTPSELRALVWAELGLTEENEKGRKKIK